MQIESDTSHLRDLLTVLFKNKFKIITIFITTVAAVTAFSFITPPVYETSSSLMIKYGREYVYRPEVGAISGQQSSTHPTEALIFTEIQVFTSIDLIEKVITTLGIDSIYPELAQNPPRKITPLQAAIIKFQKKISVQNIKGSNVIMTSFQHHNPKIAAKAVNLLVDFFKEKHLQVFSKPKSSFLEKKLIVYRQKLEESENNFEAFKQRYGVYSLDEQRSLLLQQRMEIDTSFKDARNRTEELSHKLTFLNNQLKELSDNTLLYTETERYQIVDDAKAELLTLQLNEQKLLKMYKKNNPLVTNIRKEMEIVNNFLKEQDQAPKQKERKGLNTIHQEVKMSIIQTKAELNSVTAKSNSLTDQINQLNSRLRDIDLSEKELQRLKRAMSVNETNYMAYLKKVEEARISDDMDRLKMANISIIQTAPLPAKPIKPRIPLNIAVGIVLGAVSSIGFVLFSEYYLTQSVSTPERAERLLGLPILTTVSWKKG